MTALAVLAAFALTITTYLLFKRWRWHRHTAQALAVANEQTPSAFWVCPFCGRQEWTNAPRYGLLLHIRYWHSPEPRGPEDDPAYRRGGAL